MNLITIFCIDDRGKWKFLSLTGFLPVKKGVSGGLGSRRISSLMTVYKYDPGIILRQVVLIFLLVVLLYWLGKLPGTFSPAKKKGGGVCDTAEALPTAPLTTVRGQRGPCYPQRIRSILRYRTIRRAMGKPPAGLGQNSPPSAYAVKSCIVG